MDKINVGILGATGSVGQKLIELLQNHAWFKVAEVGASETSTGKLFSHAATWAMNSAMPDDVANLTVKECAPDFESKIIFSALDASVAGDIELEFAKAGYRVISNARNFRFDPKVPLIIPEVNPGHINLIREQNFGDGFIITNPNCSTIGLVLALKPLEDKFGIESINVTTLQAISGAGFSGLTSLDVMDNVIPYIKGEEEKLETEPLKILGSLADGKIDFAEINISAQCNRISITDGHTECAQIKFREKPSREDIIHAWNSFTADPQEMMLPSAPQKPVVYFDDPYSPQPRKHRDLGGGMTVAVGRLRDCPIFDYKFTITSHNTVRGAAGGTILIAELLEAKGLLTG